MSSNITEFLSFTVKPRIAIDVQSSRENNVWNDILSVLAQQNGVQNIHWGWRLENSDEIDLLIEWISIEYCSQFKTSAAFFVFQRKLDLIAFGIPQFLYINFSPHRHLRVFQAGVMEIAIFSSFTPNFIGTFTAFTSVIQSSNGCTGVVNAPASKNIEGLDIGIGGSIDQYVAAIGWESLDTHMKAMESEEFKANVPLVEASVKDISVHHVKLTIVQ
ncbi:hypothetical protein F5884DRAFT_862139 [Xylogone sp. PMI_703]|nr:hypothetical protein F5884DRAFT_862139 [Xylogone sp. PMI_703]